MARKNSIFNAVKTDDIETVKTFLPDYINMRDADNWTPLHWACVLGHIEIVRLLLDSGADINAHDIQGGTPLHRACLNNQIEIVRLLIDRGADIEACSRYKNTPLYTACWAGYTEIVSLLLDRGANIEARDSDGWTPLHKTCSIGNNNTSELLVKRGADPMSLNNRGNSALDLDKECVQDELGNKVPHKEILMQLRAEYLNKHAVEAAKTTAALSSGWEMEI